MKVTAETLTDENVTALRDALQRKHRGRAGKQRLREITVHIRDALRGEDNQRYRGAWMNARAYVAGAYNALFEDKS